MTFPVEQLRCGSLFSGIGGMDLGLELAGFRTAWQCEIDPWRRAVLAQHWPDIPRYDDVTTLALSPADLPPVDVICGGFPCQDASVANPGGRGIEGARTGLWFHMLDLIRILQPVGVIGENVPGLLRRGLDVACRGLQDAGYEVEATRLRASDLGFSHRRERVVIVAVLADAHAGGSRARAGSASKPAGRPAPDGRGALVADTGRQPGQRDGEPAMAHPDALGDQAPQRGPGAHGGDRHAPRDHDRRPAQPRLGGTPDGLPAWVDRRCAGRGEAQYPEEPPRTAPRRRGDGAAQRVSALGNAFVPLCAYIAGMRLLERLGERVAQRRAA